MHVIGRLVNPYEAKHQALLSPYARISHLLIRDAHFLTLHGGPQLMMAHLRRAFWITRMRQVVKSAVHHCPTCIRHNQQINKQLMGSLPAERVNPAETFLHIGLDFTGPFVIRKSPGRPTSTRGKNAVATTIKAWVVIFICMATRATHIYVILGLTIEEFMAAFERFVMRKGRCLFLYRQWHYLCWHRQRAGESFGTLG